MFDIRQPDRFESALMEITGEKLFHSHQGLDRLYVFNLEGLLVLNIPLFYHHNNLDGMYRTIVTQAVEYRTSKDLWNGDLRVCL